MSRTGGGKKLKGTGGSIRVDRSRQRVSSPGAKSKGSSSRKVSLPFLIASGVGVALVSVLIAVCVRWAMTSSLNQPIGLPRVINDEMMGGAQYKERLWGSYRSNVYFGMRPRLPRSIVVGMAWMYGLATPTGEVSLYIRHTCQHADNLGRYGWGQHDGRSFGQQEITDSYMKLSTSFIINTLPGAPGESWTARIRADSRSSENATLSLLFYVFNEGTEELSFELGNSGSTIESITGDIDTIGNFRINFTPTVARQPYYSYLATDLNKISLLSHFIETVLKEGRSPLFPGERYIFDSRKTKLVVYQMHGQLPLEFEVTYSSGEQVPLVGERFGEELAKYSNYFNKKFEETFNLKEKGFSDDMIAFAQSAFSNLIGSISYFYGESLVMSPGMKKPINYFPAPLYTGVPSRSFFPRGFLWDEGFHQLLVTQWDTDIVKDVLGHWLDMLNAEGWIPREQILGEEALSKVPEEFVVQYSSNANPPALFLTVEALVGRMEETNKLMDVNYLKRIYPRLEAWYNWFIRTQKGPRPFTYQWKGRNGSTFSELNPKTLTSGLDDYPRASHPTNEEYHIDLRCWLSLATSVLIKIGNIIKVPTDDYKEYLKSLNDFDTLNKLHWDTKRQVYSDYGLHTSSVKLVTDRDANPPVEIRKVMKEPRLKFVDSFGYVNLFPFLMKLLPPDSFQLEATLT
ncbi:PREDICTED: mannosyl-oligosaccharide glucosidase GCS1-like, partial [Amphimedon queenslandica]|uniref:Mannosyl-oligosaccharide glucosidase n=1 Tax=Amphimedon queenslandica TaxID=400682 RepID=A0AAN0JVH3_AMPQE